MPRYGDYETTRPLSRGGMIAVSTVRDAAWDQESGEAPVGVVKVIEPTDRFSAEAVSRAQRLLLEQADTQRQVVEFGSALFGGSEDDDAHDGEPPRRWHWAPVLSSGAQADGAFVVFRRYELSAAQLVTGRTHLSHVDLLGIVQGVTHGLLELETALGRPHGNLKPSNVLVHRRVQGLPLDAALTDPVPACRLDGARSSLADGAALGRLLYALAIHKEFPGPAAWPLDLEPPWRRLGRFGTAWLALCNDLLCPEEYGEALSLESTASRLDEIEQDTRSHRDRQRRLVAIGSGLGFIFLILLLHFAFCGVPRSSQNTRALNRLAWVCDAEQINSEVRAALQPSDAGSLAELAAFSELRDDLQPIDELIARVPLIKRFGGVPSIARDFAMGRFEKHTFSKDDLEDLDVTVRTLQTIDTHIAEWSLLDRLGGTIRVCEKYEWNAVARGLRELHRTAVPSRSTEWRSAWDALADLERTQALDELDAAVAMLELRLQSELGLEEPATVLRLALAPNQASVPDAVRLLAERLRCINTVLVHARENVAAGEEELRALERLNPSEASRHRLTKVEEQLRRALASVSTYESVMTAIHDASERATDMCVAITSDVHREGAARRAFERSTLERQRHARAVCFPQVPAIDAWWKQQLACTLDPLPRLAPDHHAAWLDHRQAMAEAERRLSLAHDTVVRLAGETNFGLEGAATPTGFRVGEACAIVQDVRERWMLAALSRLATGGASAAEREAISACLTWLATARELLDELAVIDRALLDGYGIDEHPPGIQPGRTIDASIRTVERVPAFEDLRPALEPFLNRVSVLRVIQIQGEQRSLETFIEKHESVEVRLAAWRRHEHVVPRSAVALSREVQLAALVRSSLGTLEGEARREELGAELDAGLQRRWIASARAATSLEELVEPLDRLRGNGFEATELTSDARMSWNVALAQAIRAVNVLRNGPGPFDRPACREQLSEIIDDLESRMNGLPSDDRVRAESFLASLSRLAEPEEVTSLAQPTRFDNELSALLSAAPYAPPRMGM